MNRRAAALLLMSAALSIGATGCGKKAAEEAVEEEKYKVEVISPTVSGNIAVEGEFSGTLEYADETPVYSKLSGEITNTYFEEGDYVNAGDLMFTIDDESYSLSLRSAQAAYSNAQAGVDQQVGAIGLNRDQNAENVTKAQEGISQAANAYDGFERQMGYLQEDIDILKENREDLEDDKDSAKKKLKKARKALKNATSEEEIAGLKSTISSLKTAINTYESSIDSLDIQINTYESNRDSICMQKNNSEITYNQAVRGAGLAQEGLDYYDQHTAPDTLQSAQATLETAQVGVDSAKLQMGYTKVTAPVSGIIKAKKVDVHGMAAPGMEAYVITNDNSRIVAFNVPENTYRKLEVGQMVCVERNGKVYDGVINELPSEVDGNTGMFKIKAEVSGDVLDLAIGTAAKVTTRTDHVENVITVPVDCVFYTGGDTFVYAVDNGVVRKVLVETGLYDSENMEIISGVTPDMQIVTTWASDLRDGLEVEVE